MTDPGRQRLFLQVMSGIAVLVLADGILEFCLSGAVHQQKHREEKNLLIGTIRRWTLRRLRKAGAPFIPPSANLG